MRTIIAAVLLLAACSREHVDASKNQPSESTTMPPTTSLPTTSPLPPAGGTGDIGRDEPGARPRVAGPATEVHLSEYRIEVPETLPAGRMTFRVENAGSEQHAFEIEGNGIEAKTENLPRGNSASLDVELKPGTYTIYCPVDGHKDKGMKQTLVVK